MELVLISILAITIGGIIIYLILDSAVEALGILLKRKFSKLGDLTNYTYPQIAAKCGNPASVSYVTDNEGIKITIRQWTCAGYHIVLLFDESDRCLGISSETMV